MMTYSGSYMLLCEVDQTPWLSSQKQRFKGEGVKEMLRYFIFETCIWYTDKDNDNTINNNSKKT